MLYLKSADSSFLQMFEINYKRKIILTRKMLSGINYALLIYWILYIDTLTRTFFCRRNMLNSVYLCVSVRVCGGTHRSSRFREELAAQTAAGAWGLRDHICWRRDIRPQQALDHCATGWVIEYLIFTPKTDRFIIIRVSYYHRGLDAEWAASGFEPGSPALKHCSRYFHLVTGCVTSTPWLNWLTLETWIVSIERILDTNIAINCFMGSNVLWNLRLL